MEPLTLEQIRFYALVVAIVAIIAPRGWVLFDRSRKGSRIKGILIDNLEHLYGDLLRIRDERNNPTGEEEQRIYFDATSISEITGYDYLYKHLFLNNINDIDISKFPKTIKFFRFYLINIETLKSRVGLRESEKRGPHYGKPDGSFPEGTSHMKYNSVNNLINALTASISELRN